MWNHFDIVKAFKHVCDEREISSKHIPTFLGFIFICGRIHFVNTITAFRKAYRGLTGGFLLLQNFCVAISVSPHVCFILVLILISMFLR